MMNDTSNAETYLKFLQVYYHVRKEKKLDEKLKETTEVVVAVWEEVKKLHKVLKRETADQQAERELEVSTTKCKLKEARVKMCTMIRHCYNLFHQLLKDKPLIHPL